MGSGSGENIGSVLAGALGQGLSSAGKNLIPFKQQEKENALKDQLAVLQFAREERDKLQFDMQQQEHALTMQFNQAKLADFNLDLASKVEDTMLTPKQRVEKKVEEQRFAIQAMYGTPNAPYSDNMMGDFQFSQDNAPGGYDIDPKVFGLVREPLAELTFEQKGQGAALTQIAKENALVTAGHGPVTPVQEGENRAIKEDAYRNTMEDLGRTSMRDGVESAQRKIAEHGELKKAGLTTPDITEIEKGKKSATVASSREEELKRLRGTAATGIEKLQSGSTVDDITDQEREAIENSVGDIWLEEIKELWKSTVTEEKRFEAGVSIIGNVLDVAKILDPNRSDNPWSYSRPWGGDDWVDKDGNRLPNPVDIYNNILDIGTSKFWKEMSTGPSPIPTVDTDAVSIEDLSDEDLVKLIADSSGVQ